MDFLILIITMLLGVLGGFFLGKGTAAPVVPKKRTTSPMPSTTPAVANSAGVSGTPAHGLLLVPSNSNIHMVSTQIASSSVLVQRPLMTPSGAHLHSIWSSSSITIAPSSPISAQYRLESAVSTPANAGTPFSDVSPQTEHGLPLLSNVPPPIYSNVHGSSADHSPLTYHAVPAENDTLSAFALSPAAMIASGEAAGSLSDVHHDAQNTGLCEPLKQSALTTILPNGVRRNLIIVSLYLPVTVTRKDGGGWLVQWDQPRSDHMTPNLQMLSETMKVTWVGWPGVFVTKAEEDEISEQLELFNCRPVFMTSDLKEAFFDKCCKGVLWPLLHYRMPTSNPNFAKEWDTVWQSYTTANMLYSKQTSAIIENDHDYIWIHNYHMFLVPSFLRKRLPRAKIGFFIHTPFPTSDVFRALPGRANILRAVLCSDLVGFHTYDYARHFLSSVKRVLDLEVETLPGGSLGVTCNGRAVCIRISHVGIPSDIYLKSTKTDTVRIRSKEIRATYPGRSIIVGFDEYDVVKGTLLKFQAYERFLSLHPEYRDSVVLLEVIGGSYNAAVEKRELRAQVMDEVRNIHRLYGPDVLKVLEPPEGRMSLDLVELVATYRAAAVGLITTFWDGINIIPYEFTASQDEENPGALIVSEFMGCSRSLSGVLRVNPWRLDEVSEAITTALAMDDEERKANHRRRYHYVMNHTLESWATGFLQDLETSSAYCDDLNLVQVGWGSNVSLIGLRKNFQHLTSEDISFHFRCAHRRILIFDYDGTLTSETDRYLCRPNDELLGHLQVLCSDLRNLVFIMSGRERRVLVDWFAPVKNLGLAPEKGCYIRWPGTEQWQVTHGVNAVDWKHIALALIQQYTDRTDGSYIEDKESAIVWHYEGADPEYGRIQASELAKFLQTVLVAHQVDVVRYDYNRILEVRPKGINKGVTTKAIIHRLGKQMAEEIQQHIIKTPFFVMCVGDDRSDEEMFQALAATSSVLRELAVPAPRHTSDTGAPVMMMPQVYTCCVGLKPSNATHYLHDPQEVLGIVEGLASANNPNAAAPLQSPYPGLQGYSHGGSFSMPAPRGMPGSMGGKGAIGNLAALASLSGAGSTSILSSSGGMRRSK